MAHGARSKFGVPTFEPDVFWKQMWCIEESACDIFVTFRRGAPSHWAAPAVIRWPHSDSASGKLWPPFPIVTPLTTTES